MLRRILVLVSLLAIAGEASVGAVQEPSTDTPATIVDINSAPVEEIQRVVVDPTLAEQIVEGRPYANKRQLLTREIVSEEDYDRIKDRIVARRSTTPR